MNNQNVIPKDQIIMKKYFLIPILLVAFFMSSCESTEVELHPSNVDTDRILSQIDLSNPVVQKLYTNFISLKHTTTT